MAASADISPSPASPSPSSSNSPHSSNPSLESRLSIGRLALDPALAVRHRRRVLQSHLAADGLFGVIGFCSAVYGVTEFVNGSGGLGNGILVAGGIGVTYGAVTDARRVFRVWREYHHELDSGRISDTGFSYLDGEIVRGRTAVDRAYGRLIGPLHGVSIPRYLQDGMASAPFFFMENEGNVQPSLFFLENVGIVQLSRDDWEGHGRRYDPETGTIDEHVSHHWGSFLFTRTGEEPHRVDYHFRGLRIPERFEEMLQTPSPMSLLISLSKPSVDEKVPFEVVKIYQ